MGTKNVLLIEMVYWLHCQDPKQDDPEQAQILKDILMSLTNPNDDTDDFLELTFGNLEFILIYFIKLKNLFSRYPQFYPQMIDFFSTGEANGFFGKILDWVVKFEKFINSENNFADITELLVSWQGDVDFMTSKIELIKNLLIHYLHIKNILEKYPDALDALVLLYS